MSSDIVPSDSRSLIHSVRGVTIILDADLAAALGITTGAFNQAVQRHEGLIDERHRFQLTRGEFDDLKSQSVISSSGWGGRRTLPWAYTERGVARVTTFVSTPEAIRAADLIIDTFLTVHKQIAAGRREIAIADPARYIADPDIVDQSRALGKRLMTAINGLLDTVIDIRTGDSVADAARDMTARALEHLRERFREKGLENLKLEAEIRMILQEAEKVAQEVEGKKLDNLEKRITLVQKLIAMHREVAPTELVRLLDRFDSGEAIPLSAPGEETA